MEAQNFRASDDTMSTTIVTEESQPPTAQGADDNPDPSIIAQSLNADATESSAAAATGKANDRAAIGISFISCSFRVTLAGKFPAISTSKFDPAIVTVEVATVNLQKTQ